MKFLEELRSDLKADGLETPQLVEWAPIDDTPEALQDCMAEGGFWSEESTTAMGQQLWTCYMEHTPEARATEPTPNKKDYVASF